MTVIPLTPVASDLAERTEFRAEIVPLYDLYRQIQAKGGTAISGKTFVNCRIDGPAVLLALGGVDFNRSFFGEHQGDVRNLLLKPMGEKAVTGAIPVQNCAFTECNFFSIGFTGAPDFLEQMEAALRATGEPA